VPNLARAHMRRRIHVCHMRRRICVSYEEEDTCVPNLARALEVLMYVGVCARALLCRVRTH
jgi:hypothetical protein